MPKTIHGRIGRTAKGRKDSDYQKYSCYPGLTHLPSVSADSFSTSTGQPPDGIKAGQHAGEASDEHPSPSNTNRMPENYTTPSRSVAI